MTVGSDIQFQEGEVGDPKKRPIRIAAICLGLTLSFIAAPAKADLAAISDRCPFEDDVERVACLLGRAFEASGSPLTEPWPSNPGIRAGQETTRGGSAERYRIEVFGGLGIGDHQGDVEIGVFGADLLTTLDSVFGGAGPVFGGGLWADRVGSSSLAIGVEYLHLHNQSDVSAVLPLGFTTASAVVEATLTADLAFVSALWRFNHDAAARPFVGAGIGVGRFNLDVVADFQSIFGTGTEFVEETGAFPAVQLIAGFEVDLFGPVFVGVTGRFLYTTAKPFGTNQTFRQFIGTGVTGLRF